MPGDGARLLEAACAVGDQLVRDAVWWDGRCTWLGDAVELDEDEWRVVHRSCAGDLYAGTSGVGVFLARLAEHTGDDRHGAAARGALLQALAGADGDLSLYGGATGVAWAAAEAGRATGDDELLEHAAALTARIAADAAGGVFADDLVGGRAGVALGLLDLGRRLGLPAARSAALDLGEALVAVAHRDASGLSWPLGTPPGEPGLCGLGHGAAGVAHALLELHAAGGDAALGAAAASAAAYERAWLSPAQANWPDLRGLERDAVAAGTLPAYSSFWCHGSVGVGLARLRAWELTGSQRDLADAGIALQAATHDARALVAGGDPSLCHGVAGLAELFLYAGEVLGRPEHRAVGCRLAATIVDARERTGTWGSGVLGGGEAPGLMVGLAGLGCVLLRAALPGRSAPAGLLCVPAATISA